jgi:hypothetical protein
MSAVPTKWGRPTLLLNDRADPLRLAEGVEGDGSGQVDKFRRPCRGTGSRVVPQPFADRCLIQVQLSGRRRGGEPPGDEREPLRLPAQAPPALGKLGEEHGPTVEVAAFQTSPGLFLDVQYDC